MPKEAKLDVATSSIPLPLVLRQPLTDPGANCSFWLDELAGKSCSPVWELPGFYVGSDQVFVLKQQSFYPLSCLQSLTDLCDQQQ